MLRAVGSILSVCLLLSACDRPARDADKAAVDASNPLEIAARERGIVRAEAASPTGVFERRHELGRDAMCVVPEGEGRWRFAVAASYGPGLSCTAHGAMTREGEGWRLRFAGVDGCDALVQEQGDEIRLPGSLPPQCQNLCPAHASLSGLFLPRASWAEADAKRLQMPDGRGNMIAACGE